MSLVTVEQYQALTLDTDSLQGDVEEALDTAQGLVEEYLRRQLTSDEYTETLTPDRFGQVFPSVTPITEAEGYTITGNALSGVFPSLVSEAITVTYTGGYETETLPTTIRRGICYEAYSLLNQRSDIPSGATSVRLGDASITFAKPSSSALSSRTAEDALRRYRRRFV